MIVPTDQEELVGIAVVVVGSRRPRPRLPAAAKVRRDGDSLRVRTQEAGQPV
jgi:hypothetical protein